MSVEHAVFDLTDAQRGYLAGLIDGEGYLGIALSKRSPQYTLGFQRRAILEIANTDIGILQAAQTMIRCGSVTTKRRATDKWSALYRLTLSGNMLRRILPQVAPLLVGKRRQATLVLEHLGLQTPLNHKYKPGVSERMQELFLECSELNQRRKT